LSFEYAWLTPEEQPSATDDAGGQNARDDQVADDPLALPAHHPRHCTAAEKCHSQSVHGGHERAEACVDYTAGDEELEGIGRNPEHIEEKRDRDVDAPEERHQPRQRQLRVLSDRHRRIREPPGKQHETDREQLAGVRKVERGRHDDVRQILLRLLDARLRYQRPARFDEHRQDDEQIAGDEGGDEAVARQREDVTGANRRQCRH